MASKQNTTQDSRKEKAKLNISEDMIKKDDKSDDFERDLDNYRQKRRDRISVYTHRPFAIPPNGDGNNSLFILNSNDYVDILHKKYMFFINKYEHILEDSSKMNKTLEENQKIIDDLNSQLKKMKEEKKKRQKDIVNYLSNKESLEEIFNNKVNYLTNKKKDEKSKFEEKEINLNLDMLKKPNPIDSQLYNIEDEKELEIKLEEIKKSDKKKFTEKVINLAEELLLKKGDEEFINKIKSKIKIAYNIFFSEISSNSVINNESIISHFFSRIGLYISNHSLGQYSETSVNKFLRYLLKINSINVEIAQIMKFLNKKYKEQKIDMRNKINELKKKNENLKEKKNVNDGNLDKYEKIIQKNKENIKNVKNDAQLDGKKQKKYMIHTLDRASLRKKNKLRIMTDTNFLNSTELLSPRMVGEEVEIENLANSTLSNDINRQYQNTEIGYQQNKNRKKSTFFKMKEEKEKQKENENEIEDKDFEKNNKSSDEIIDANKNKGKPNVVIPKNNKVVVKNTGKQHKINKQNKPKEKNQNNEDNKKTNSNDNLNFFDDSKDIDSELNSKSQSNNSNTVKQNYVIIKNDISDIDIKDNNGKKESSKDINNNNNNSNIKKENIKIKKPNTQNNYLIKKTNIVKKENTQNNPEDKNKINEKKDIGDKDKNIIHNKNSNSQQTAKYNKNIYIINNINNSEQIQTKNNIYGNKSNNVKINSGGNLNYYNDNTPKTNNRKVNITDNINKTNYGDANKNKQVVKINNNYVNKNTNQDKEAKNKTNYNFHDILHTNSQKNNNSYQITNSDSTRISEKNYRIENLATTSHKLPENTTQKVFQKSSYDQKASNNKGNVANNNNTQTIVGRYSENRPGETVYTKTNVSSINTNNNYKISVPTKRSERNAEKNKQNS